MSWTYGYQAGPEGGPYTALLDYCDDVRVPNEADAAKRGSNVTIPYADGEFSDPNKWREAGMLMLDCMVSYTDSAGLVTHADGAAGHIYENLSELRKLLGGEREHVVIRRTAPHQGAVEAVCENLGGVKSSGPRMRYVFPMRMVEGVWREQTLQTDTQTNISSFPNAYTIDTGGNYDIGDAKITITCKAAGSNPSLTYDTGSQTINIPGAFILNDEIIIDLAQPRSFTLNGSRYAPINANRGWWFRLPSDVTGLPLTFDADSGTWDVKIEWRNKWL